MKEIKAVILVYMAVALVAYGLLFIMLVQQYPALESAVNAAYWAAIWPLTLLLYLTMMTHG